MYDQLKKELSVKNILLDTAQQNTANLEARISQMTLSDRPRKCHWKTNARRIAIEID